MIAVCSHGCRCRPISHCIDNPNGCATCMTDEKENAQIMIHRIIRQANTDQWLGTSSLRQWHTVFQQRDFLGNFITLAALTMSGGLVAVNSQRLKRMWLERIQQTVPRSPCALAEGREA